MVGLALGCIGKYYARTKQFAKAVEVSFEAVKLLKKFSEAVVTAEAIVDVGTILKGWGRTKYAMHFFRFYVFHLDLQELIILYNHAQYKIEKTENDPDASFYLSQLNKPHRHQRLNHIQL